MRKSLSIILVMVFLSLVWPVAVSAAGITVSLNGEIMDLGGVPPVLEQGRVLVPLRSVFEKMGAAVDWNNVQKQVEVHRGNEAIILPLKGQLAYINGVGYEIDVPPKMENGRTFVPLRFISQALGAAVDWDKQNQRVAINSRGGFLPKEIWGYYVDYNSYTSLENNVGLVSHILPFSYKLGENADIIETVYFPQGQELAQDNNIPVYALVFAEYQDLLSRTLGSAEKRASLIEEMLSIALKRGYQGINLDWEKLKAEDRDNYSLFVKDLSARLHSQGLGLTLSVPAKAHDEFSWTKAYDYAALGQSADRLIIMAYDQHYSGSAPGPVAGLKWVDSVVKYAKSQVAGEKLLLGLGLYGYDWPAGKPGKTLDLYGVSQIDQGERTWNSEEYAPCLTYLDPEGVRHEVWYENQQSVQGKLELAKRYDLAGVALWRLGLVPQEVWDALAAWN